ncbi:hypothetical protein ISN45_Aa07g016560 [Arabidopsis thaliana x Arabidopsis arenosa]|uniref:Uncharacterized protein n=1 Tax=Arabidopsis thaliana x Arabidopsis arenosa TaxID=1240361 RepID=A0A8T1Y3I8_9BRAS|nr:hypothetical protein ISN45_Aa07g016560 [Arabidopsis thaliana x Arabidopsis arenosa]
MKKEEREENRHEGLQQQLRELEEEWTAMKTGKNSSAVSWITVEEALDYVENSPRNLMLSLQHKPEAEIIQERSPLRRKLFHDSDDDDDQTKKTTLFSHSSCWSSNVTSSSDTRKSKKKTTMGRIVSITMVMLLSWVLFVLMNCFDHLSMNTHINTLVPT